jgi:cytochrome c-type biogenesis protein CcmH
MNGKDTRSELVKRPVRWPVLIAAALVLALAWAVGTVPAQAQDGGGITVTDDDVNSIARGLYCPVCENVPLDVCPTAACAEWREEIRVQLSEGATPREVVNNFVARYGDRVVGTPQDPTLRALSLVTPWVISGLALLGALLVFARWRREQMQAPTTTPVRLPEPGEVNTTLDAYRARLEADLAKRR